MDDALGLGKDALAQIEDIVSLTKNTILPVVIIFVTLWVAMCTAGAVACCIVKRGRHVMVPSAVPSKAGSAMFYNVL